MPPNKSMHDSTSAFNAPLFPTKAAADTNNDTSAKRVDWNIFSVTMMQVEGDTLYSVH